MYGGRKNKDKQAKQVQSIMQTDIPKLSRHRRGSCTTPARERGRAKWCEKSGEEVKNRVKEGVCETRRDSEKADTGEGTKEENTNRQIVSAIIKRQKNKQLWQNAKN